MQKKVVNIPHHIELADSFFKRLKGLMFRQDPIQDEGLWIVPCNAVHMFFMKFPLDIVLLSEQNEVIGLHHCLQPWKITKPVKNAYSTLELPAGSAEKLGIRIGSIIQCQN
ncbi:DUF192 domain-containing protein [Bacillus sp. EB106-08-02-XG196]|jgi:uncharacterized protein|uniref:DUF192 domain-containing protein n=1 Tax=Bacillus sp. EB106-08-02-XG196 TaxID=2737049 RepID=UPI0015C47449|nr:DUF192 domain-containing protein [Bacillus sp. EB106-08-02-XG196]NWQ39369.1 DUF192 domain-containing protein [Bacillus sp. EB106-08-02-XG196]